MQRGGVRDQKKEGRGRGEPMRPPNGWRPSRAVDCCLVACRGLLISHLTVLCSADLSSCFDVECLGVEVLGRPCKLSRVRTTTSHMD